MVVSQVNDDNRDFVVQLSSLYWQAAVHTLSAEKAR